MILSSFSDKWRGVAWLLAEKAVALLMGFFVGNWVARALGPSDFGKFSIALTIAGVLTTVTTMGLDTVLLRRFAMDAGNTGRLLVSAMWLRLLGGLAQLVVCVLVALVFFGGDLEGLLATLLIAVSALLRLLEVAGLHLQVHDRYQRAVGIRIVGRLVGDAARIALILWSPTIVGFALALVLEAMVGGVLFLLAERSQWAAKPPLDRELAASLFREGLPIAVSGLLSGIYAKLDQAIVFTVLGAAASGQYAAAVRVSELFSLLVVSLGAVAAPHFARLAALPPEDFDRRLQPYTRAMTALGLAAGLVLSLAAEPIVKLLYGSAFLPAIDVLRIHAWSIPLLFLSVALEPWFYHYGKLDLYVVKTAITLVLAAPLTLAGAWIGGAEGVAASLVLVYAISVLGTNLLLPQARAAFRFQLSVLLGVRRSSIP